MDFQQTYDAHIHMALDGADWKSALFRHAETPDEAYIRRVLAAYADAGVTYLRDGGDKFGAAACAARIAGEYGIAYASPVACLYQKGNYGSFLGWGYETFGEYCSLVDTCVAQGASFVKIMTTGILDFDEYGKLTGYALDAALLSDMVAYAHDLGLSVMAHTNGAQAVIDAVTCGVDSIEHGYYLDAASCAILAQSNTIWVPTFAPICNVEKTGRFADAVLARIAQSQRENVAEVARLGGIIACGSDAGAACVFHGQAAHDEYRLMRQALGENCEIILARGLAELQKRFPGARA